MELIGGICGAGFLYARFYIRNSNRKIQKKGIKTKAKIVDFVKVSSKDADGLSHLYHFPIVQFTNINRREVTQKLDSSENPKRINQQIEIIYLNRNNKYEILLNNVSSM